MVIFNGKVSIECRKFIFSKLRKIWCFSGLFALLITGCPIILIAKNNLVLYIYMAIPICGFVLFCFIPKIMIRMYTFSKIDISNDYLLSNMGGKAQLRDISDVKVVVDWGEWYDIIFYFPYKSVGFICQKDLIVEGTIEEFEKLFEDKIVRKHEEKD